MGNLGSKVSDKIKSTKTSAAQKKNEPLPIRRRPKDQSSDEEDNGEKNPSPIPAEKQKKVIQKGDMITMGGVEYVIQSMGDVVECTQCGNDTSFPMVIYLTQNQLDFVERIEWKKGDRFSMGGDGGIEYTIQSIGDIVECKQHARDGKDTAFPEVMYLAVNQLRFVQRVTTVNDRESAYNKGDRMTTGGVEYVLQNIGDVVECVQSGDNDAFPAVVYLTLNQLEYVQFTEGAERDETVKEEGTFKVGDQLVMGGVEYVIERMGDIVECKQPGNGGGFPAVVFLAMNQLKFAGRK